MAKPFQNKWRGPPSGRKRRYSDMVDSYYGPQEFIEAGFRGFLLTTEPCCEENSLDIAIRILRQAAVKVYGAVQKDGPDITDWTGFVKYEIGEYTKVKLLMDEGNTEKGAEETTDKQDNKENKNGGPGEEGIEAQEKNLGEKDDEKEGDASNNEINEDKIGEPMEDIPNEDKVLDESAASEKDSEKSKEESDAGKEDVKKSEGESDAGKEDVKKSEEESDAGKDVKKSEEENDKEKEVDDDIKNGDTDDKDKKAEKKKDGDKNKQSDRKTDKNSKDQRRRKSPEKKKEPMRQWYPRFRGPYKFKAFRTELRNLMFIQSDVPDPALVVSTLYDSFDSSWIGRQKGKVDLEGINQLIPVLGVCNNNCHQLEIMSRRVLASIFDENYPPKTFSVLLFDAMSEPGSELLIETVRNAIWSLNPASLQASPLIEPDVVIRLEVIGSKLILCCMTGFMKYREYTPVHLHWLGQGEGEDDDGSFNISKNFQFDRARKQERKRERRLEHEKKDRERERKSEKSEKTQEEKSESKLREGRAKFAEGAEEEKDQKVEYKPEDGQTQTEDEDKMEGIAPESVTSLPRKKRKSDATEEMETSSERKGQEEEDADISGVTDATEEEAAQEQEEEETKRTSPKKKATRGRRTGTRKTKK